MLVVWPSLEHTLIKTRMRQCPKHRRRQVLWPHHIVLWPLHICHRMYTCTCKHIIHMCITNKDFKKKQTNQRSISKGAHVWKASDEMKWMQWVMGGPRMSVTAYAAKEKVSRPLGLSPAGWEHSSSWWVADSILWKQNFSFLPCFRYLTFSDDVLVLITWNHCE